MTGFRSTLATIWRLAVPYFRSEDRVAGRILLAAVVAIELSLVAHQRADQPMEHRFYNALQDRNWDAFVSELHVLLRAGRQLHRAAVYQLYLNQWLQIRWRRWMTDAYLGDWLDDANHYRMQLLGDAADNPDQRIAEDIKLFIEDRTARSADRPRAAERRRDARLVRRDPVGPVGGRAAARCSAWTDIPGYLVWAALIYAVVGTLLTHLIGRPLIRAQLQSAALRSRLPLQPRARARELRADRAAATARRAETRAPARPLRARGGQLAADHDAAEAADVLHRGLQSGLGGVSLHRRQPGLFRRPHAARRPDADRVRLQQRADRAVVLHQRVSRIRRMARRDRAARRLRGGDRERARDRHDAAGDRGRAAARRGADRARRARRGAAERQAAGRRRRHRVRAARAGAGHRPVGLGQVDAVPRHRRHLAVRHRQRSSLPAGRAS